MANAIAHQVYIGIGSNVGNKRENFFEAVDARRQTARHSGDQRILALRKRAAGRRQRLVRQRRHRNRNQIQTGQCCSKKFKNIERVMGRKKVKKRWGARIIDLDILLLRSPRW